MSHAPTSLPYLGGLDGLRCIAVSAVIVHHTRYFLVSDAFLMPRGGFLGVDVFFVISGFLITALLLVENQRDSSISLPGFYWRRAVRLLPALLPVLLAHLLYTSINGLGGRAEMATVLTSLGFTTNWWRVFGGETVPGLGHLWSLAVEEQFYLIWPAVVILALRRRRASTAITLVSVAIGASMIWRIVLWSSADGWLDVYIRTDARADQLLIGALLALLWFHGLLPERSAAIAWIGACFLGIAMIVATPESPVMYFGGFTLVAVATGMVLIGCINNDWGGVQILNLRPFRIVGQVSYGLYLWHEPVLWAVSQKAKSLPLAAQLVLTFAVVAIATTASWQFLEQPVAQYKHRFGKPLSQVPAPKAATSSAEIRQASLS